MGEFNWDEYESKLRVSNAKWDTRFLGLAEYVAQWSKDPSTKTGAVIVGQDTRRLVSVGFNGFAAGVDDSEERYNNRELKYKMIVHCERNAMLYAKSDLAGCTLYTWPFSSCAPCAAMVIQAGIDRVVAPELKKGTPLWDRWADELTLALQMFHEAGVETVLL